MKCFGTTNFDNNSRLITLSVIIISGFHCISFLHATGFFCSLVLQFIVSFCTIFGCMWFSDFWLNQLNHNDIFYVQPVSKLRNTLFFPQIVPCLFLVHPALTIPDQNACDIYRRQLVSGWLSRLVRMSKLYTKLQLLDRYRPYLF